MSRKLIDALIDNELAQWDPDGWVVTHPDFARAYMSALAERVARETASNPITDDPLSHVAASGWPPENLAEILLGVAREAPAREPSAAAPALAFVAFRSVVPTGLEQLDADRLVKIRHDYGAELSRFRAAVAAIAAQAGLAAETRPEVYERQLADLYRTRIKPEVDQLTHDLRLLKVKTVESVLSIKTTVPPAAAVLLARHVEPSTATAAGVAVGVFQLRQAMAERARLDMAESPAAYLLRLQHTVDAQDRSLMASIRASARRMMLGL